jgi:hypothetical protein
MPASGAQPPEDLIHPPPPPPPTPHPHTPDPGDKELACCRAVRGGEAGAPPRPSADGALRWVHENTDHIGGHLLHGRACCGSDLRLAAYTFWKAATKLKRASRGPASHGPRPPSAPHARAQPTTTTSPGGALSARFCPAQAHPYGRYTGCCLPPQIAYLHKQKVVLVYQNVLFCLRQSKSRSGPAGGLREMGAGHAVWVESNGGLIS